MRVLGKARHIGEHRVDRRDNRRRQSPRHVGGEARGVEMRAQKIRRRVEHPRLAAAEAVDRLLGVAHHEHRHRAVGAARFKQPGRKRLPLQRVGVLEFVEQQMPVARVQLQRQRRRVLLAAQKAAGLPFGIGEIDHPLLHLGVLIGRQQRVAEQQAVAVERPDALVGLDRGDGFQRGFQHVEVAQVGVESGAERVFQFLRRLFLAPLARRHQVSHECGMRLTGRQAQAALDFRRPRPFALAAFFQRKARPLHPRRHRLVGPECRHRIALQIGVQARLQLFQRMRHRVGRLVGVRPPFRAGIDKALQQRAQIVLADVGQQGQQRRAFRRIGRACPLRQQAVAHLVLQQAGALKQRRAPRQPGFQRRAFQQIEKPAMESRHRRPRLRG